MKYIDADRLREELQKPKSELKVGNYYLDNSEQAVGYESALIDFEFLIDSFQEEQPEVDFKKEIKEWTDLMVGASFSEQDGAFISEEDYRSVIRQTAIHFLGLNARKV